jgi:hypothetical protein
MAKQQAGPARILWIVLAGMLLGTTQTLRGAHYPSHTLWTGMLCWLTALANHQIFAPLGQSRRSPPGSPELIKDHITHMGYSELPFAVMDVHEGLAKNHPVLPSALFCALVFGALFKPEKPTDCLQSTNGELNWNSTKNLMLLVCPARCPSSKPKKHWRHDFRASVARDFNRPGLGCRHGRFCRADWQCACWSKAQKAASTYFSSRRPEPTRHHTLIGAPNAWLAKKWR